MKAIFFQAPHGAPFSKGFDPSHMIGKVVRCDRPIPYSLTLKAIEHLDAIGAQPDDEGPRGSVGARELAEAVAP